MKKEINKIIVNTIQFNVWDKLEEDMKEKKYDMLLKVLEETKLKLCNLIPNNIELHQQLHEIIDIKLLDQMLKHNAVDDKYIFSLINFIITQLKDFDSIDNEPSYEKWRNLINIHLSSNTPLYIIIPTFLRETFFYIDEIEYNITNS